LFLDYDRYCKAHDVPLDFLSTDSYPTDPPNGRWAGGAGKQAETAYQFKSMEFAATQAKQLGYPLYITEWSSDPGSRSLSVGASAAAGLGFGSGAATL